MEQLKMYRPAGLALPEIQVPEGFALREMRPGEEALWGHCCEGEFGIETPEDAKTAYARMMANDPAVELRNVFFVCDGTGPIGTACARTVDGQAYLHYVAVRPEGRGKRLSYSIVPAVLHRHAEEGRADCLLSTDDWRVNAIRCYLRMGFRPVLWTDDARERWTALLPKVGSTGLETYDLNKQRLEDVR